MYYEIREEQDFTGCLSRRDKISVEKFSNVSLRPVGAELLASLLVNCDAIAE
jgi:hypothetical protein